MNTKQEDGQVIVASLIILLILVIVIISLFLLINGEISFMAREKNEIKALYTAEAGLEYASIIISANNKWATDEENSDSDAEYALLIQKELARVNNAINGGTVDNLTKIIDYNRPNSITLVSTASCGGITKSITNEFLLSSKAFNYSFVANEEIDMGNTNTIIGNDEGGDIYSNNYINYGNKFFTNKELYESQEKDIVPAIDFVELKNHESVTVYSPPEGESNLKFSAMTGDISNAFTYIEGDFTIDNNVTINGSGVLVVEGKMTVKNNIDINSSSDDFFLIFIKGDTEEENALSIESGNKADIKAFIYANGSMDFPNSPTLTGTIISTGELSFKNSLNFTFDNSYLDNFLDWNIDIPVGSNSTNEVFQLINWQES